ncbi:MAG: alpha/beta hydrolase domain-containing protein [Gemmataceae bacterium]|nr:alpha/beta hydrolase domain-containing protein [Gemmataceae bacterium]
MRHRYVALLVMLVVGGPARAELLELKVLHREPYENGRSFGAVGAYEKIVGIARYALDPQHPKNAAIVDLNLAPTNHAGRVEFAADVFILAPKDLSQGNGAIFYDVNNRGNKLALGMFNTPPDNPFLMLRGYTIVWSGWIGELLPGGGRLLLQPPVAQENGKPVRGLVRFEMSTDKPVPSMPLSRRDHHGSYRPTSEGLAKATLTRRRHVDDPPTVVPPRLWELKVQPMIEVKEGVPGTLPEVRLELVGGFEPGVLYELTCECEGSLVQGTGLAAVRDLVSFLRYDVSRRNPLQRADAKPPFDRALAFGVSQSGRFLRHFLWQGFNEDENGQIVFDGLMPHVAGGGLGFFNHRFAQPTRHNGQHEDHTYPCDMPPFAYGSYDSRDEAGGDAILAPYAKSAKQPKVIHTQSAAEYWHRSGSLVHTDPTGSRDIPIPATVRIYAFGGTQHGPAAEPVKPGLGQNLANPADYRPFLRALLDALDAWVRTGKEPPPSFYPRIDADTLVSRERCAGLFPKLPGVKFPEVIQQPALPHYAFWPADKGFVAVPPWAPMIKVVRVLVPRCDQDGNDVGTLNLPDVAVPLATYTGWNLRRAEVGAADQLANLLGSYLPFPRTKEERLKTGDPRISIEECYGTFEKYRKRYAEACERLVAGRYLLPEDAQRLIDGRDKVRPLFAR